MVLFVKEFLCFEKHIQSKIICLSFDHYKMDAFKINAFSFHTHSIILTFAIKEASLYQTHPIKYHKRASSFGISRKLTT